MRLRRVLPLSSVTLAIVASFAVGAEATRSVRLDPAANLDVTHYGMAKSCRQFINEKGELGEWGQKLISAIEEIDASCYYQEIDFSALCPAYKTFQKERKQQFLAFLFAAIAQEESSCRPHVQVDGINDLAVGLFQLEDTWQQRKNANRNPEYCPHHGVNSYSLSFQVRCSVSIFREGYCRRQNQPGIHGWYWQRLNGKKSISRRVRQFPYC